VSEEFDYVVVGAGSAGCVLAARLSEDPDVRVALLEAGGEDTAPEIRVPAIFPIMFKTELDWDLFGDPEPGMDNRRLYLPRGRMLGGCSSINAMIYVRGNRLDYDAWAAAGCDGPGRRASAASSSPSAAASASAPPTRSCIRCARGPT
jgi:choline dehydrogenase